jgi:hypothetical protein
LYVSSAGCKFVPTFRQLDELFLLVIAGEFNSGKSAFINALVGRQLLPEGVTPTTNQIHLLKYGQEVAQIPGAKGVIIQTAPVDTLRNVNIVDTPGTNAIMREHEALTAEFIPRSDLVLFLTSVNPDQKKAPWPMIASDSLIPLAWLRTRRFRGSIEKNRRPRCRHGDGERIKSLRPS